MKPKDKCEWIPIMDPSGTFVKHYSTGCLFNCPPKVLGAWFRYCPFCGKVFVKRDVSLNKRVL